MEDYGEIEIRDFVRLMRNYLEGRVNAAQYQNDYSELMTKRFIVPSEDVSKILQKAFGDADDYDPAVRLQHTIEEPELRRRVAESIKQLMSLGYSAK